MPVSAIEIEKKLKQETIPLAWFFVSEKNRKDINAFYSFARMADEIADSTEIPCEKKIEQLELLEKAHGLKGADKVPEILRSYYAMIREGRLSSRFGRKILKAMRQDTTKHNYNSLEELMEYCRYSAEPVGQAVLEICREFRADKAASNALCSAMQIINHIQGMEEDAKERQRYYFPVHKFIKKEDGQMPAAFDRVIEKALDRVDILLRKAQKLPKTIGSFRLRVEIAVMIQMAKKLAAKLRRSPALRGKARLHAGDKLKCVAKGFWVAFKCCFHFNRKNSYFGKIVKTSKSSFFWPIILLRGEKRRAMLALYYFCKEVDNFIDNPAKESREKHRKLNRILRELDIIYEGERNPKTTMMKDLAKQIRLYNLPKKYFEEIIEGMRMDADYIQKPSVKTLDRYCYCVASCVGLLSIEIFGYKHKETRDFAIHLGKGMQLTNILRDVEEDAKMGRIYLPMEMLQRRGLEGIMPAELTKLSENSKFSSTLVLAEIAKLAKNHFTKAMQALHPEDADAMRPALAMYRLYSSYLKELEARGWNPSAKKRLRPDIASRLQMISIMTGFRKKFA